MPPARQHEKPRDARPLRVRRGATLTHKSRRTCRFVGLFAEERRKGAEKKTTTLFTISKHALLRFGASQRQVSYLMPRREA